MTIKSKFNKCDIDPEDILGREVPYTKTFTSLPNREPVVCKECGEWFISREKKLNKCEDHSYNFGNKIFMKYEDVK